MSRIGKLPIQIPSGVTVTVSDDHVVTVKGPKGTLAQSVNNQMGLEIKDGIMHVTRPNDLKQFRAMHGLYRALIHNMVVGVTTGFTKNLELVGVGYRAHDQHRLQPSRGCQGARERNVRDAHAEQDHRQRHR